MRSFYAIFARNVVFSNIVLVLIFAAGLFAALSMVRELFPEFSLDLIQVTVPWPGADPADVEEGICIKIEEAIDGLEGIKQYNSISGENLGLVTVEVDPSYDTDDVKERVRNRVEAINTFPEESEKPIIEELTIRREVLMVALYGEGLDERRLKEWAEDINDELRMQPGISQVKIFGAREYEIAIELSEEKLREYGLTFDQVAQVIRASNLNLTGGTVRTQGEDIRLRTVGRKYTGAELAEIVVKSSPNGEKITLDRVANIHDAFTEDPIISRYNGHPTLAVAVLKTQEEDSLAIKELVTKFVAEKEQELPDGIHMAIWSDNTDILNARINLLTSNGVVGLLLVFGLLWLFLDFRLSFWVGMGMPTSIAGALAIMWMLGATINMISLFGLIMVLGIIVDDAIVVGEAIYVHRKNGEPPLKAAIEGVTEVGMPVVAAVTTTIVAFVPLLLVEGLMGKFIAILPIVVIACLSISLVESLILLPAHLSHMPDPGAKVTAGHPLRRMGQRFHQYTSEGMEWFVDHVYEPFLGDRVLQYRYISLALAVAVLILTFGFMQSGFLKFEFFPNLDGNQITATVEFPEGTPLKVTEDAIARMEEALRRVADETPTSNGEPMIENMFSLVGSTIADDRPRYGNHLGSVRVEMLDSELRGVHTNDLMAAWEREIGPLPGVESLAFTGMEAGPPGAAIEVWLQGNNMDHLLAAADALKEKLGTYEGVYQVAHDFRPGKNEMRFELKDEARALGITVADLARQVYAGYYGEEALRVQRGRDDIRIRVRYTEAERKQIDELSQVRIRTPQGQEVPLMSVANVEYGPGLSNINRTDGMRRVAVTAEVNPGKANANEIFEELSTGYFDDLQRKYPGMLISLQGEKKNMRESFGSLFVTYPLALLGIFIIIATMFRSYVQPLIIMITVPFGIIGAVLGHMLLGYNLTIMSFFGMVALSGVVVNDAIVMIERINEFMAEGKGFRESVRLGGARRFRAVFLTTITTVGGLMPLILEKDMQAQFLVPMAISIAAGVAFATLLTLVLIPCLLVILNDLRRVVRWSITREWPTAEEVEPARLRNVDFTQQQPGDELPAPQAN